MNSDDDAALRDRVLAELDWDPRFDAGGIAVTAEQGELTLSGHVPNYRQLFDALRAARRVSGVRSIANLLAVRVPDADRRDDEDIARSIAHVLECNTTATEQDVNASVRKGIVTLEGSVAWHHERRHVEEQIAHVNGVVSIVNRIEIAPRPVPDDVKSRIDRALARNARVSSDNVKVLVDGHTITLEGSVKALHERQALETAAWSAPGVRRVVDHLRVG